MYKNIVAISDIHGCSEELEALLGKVKITSDTLLVFMGDYIDRGRNSYEVLEIIVQLKQKLKDNCVILMGNHERMMIDAVDSGDRSMWYNNGGAETIRSFYKHGKSIFRYANWARKLPLFYKTDKFIFSHAGMLYPEVEDNGEDEFLWGREHIDEYKIFPKIVVFGHTPSQYFHNRAEAYTTKSGSIGIDTGCVFGGRLCAFCYNVDKDEIKFIYNR